jgi:hypothetical protein
MDVETVVSNQGKAHDIYDGIDTAVKKKRKKFKYES